jgi:hypothetical protein
MCSFAMGSGSSEPMHVSTPWQVTAGHTSGYNISNMSPAFGTPDIGVYCTPEDATKAAIRKQLEAAGSIQLPSDPNIWVSRAFVELYRRLLLVSTCLRSCQHEPKIMPVASMLESLDQAFEMVHRI